MMVDIHQPQKHALLIGPNGAKLSSGAREQGLHPYHVRSVGFVPAFLSHVIFVCTDL